VLDSNAPAKLARRAQIAKALAHPSRLLIVDELLRHGERCVCELTKLVGADMSTVSRHLAVLRVAGIVADEKRGQQVFYRLGTPGVRDFVCAMEDVVGAITQEQVGLLTKAC
jgi:ArsR family transcriptional regulator